MEDIENLDIFTLAERLANDETINKIRKVKKEIEEKLSTINLNYIDKILEKIFRYLVYKRQIIGLVYSEIKPSYIRDIYYCISPSYGIGKITSVKYKKGNKNVDFSGRYFDRVNFLEYSKYLAVRDLSPFISKNKLDIYKYLKETLKNINKNSFQNLPTSKLFIKTLNRHAKEPKREKFIENEELNIGVKVRNYWSGLEYNFEMRYNWNSCNLSLDSIQDIWNDRKAILIFLEKKVLPFVNKQVEKYNAIINSKSFKKLSEKVKEIEKTRYLMGEL